MEIGHREGVALGTQWPSLSGTGAFRRQKPKVCFSDILPFYIPLRGLPGPPHLVDGPPRHPPRPGRRQISPFRPLDALTKSHSLIRKRTEWGTSGWLGAIWLRGRRRSKTQSIRTRLWRHHGGVHMDYWLKMVTARACNRQLVQEVSK
jgi:hypothetical protein